MPTMLVYDPIKAEINLIRSQLAGISEEKEELVFRSAVTLPEFAGQVSAMDRISVSCTDFDADGEVPIRMVKDRDPSALPVIIVDSSTPPLLYVRPDIMAAGLLLRPLSGDQVAAVLREIMAAVRIRQREELFNNEVFVFSTKEGSVRIPYSQILYFEARNKKIVACTSRSETAFYETLENLAGVLPEYFMRCHKGFIVNKLMVEKVDMSQNVLHMICGFHVPISRSYRSRIKEALT